MTRAGSEPDLARRVAGQVPDPELPLLTLADLGMLREVTVTGPGRVRVAMTPTYTGCPALEAIRQDLLTALHEAGFDQVEVDVVLDPPWTTDWITPEGRRKLDVAGIAPPGPAPVRGPGPVPLLLGPPRRDVACPRCGHPQTDELAEFSATACRSLRRCPSCLEPFEQIKEV